MVALEGGRRRASRSTRRATGICVVLVGADGERTMLPDPGANAALATPDGGIDGEVVYVAGYALMRPVHARRRARLAGGRPRGRRAHRRGPGLRRAARGGRGRLRSRACDLLLPNADEAAVLGEERLRAIARETVVKHGAEGATWSDGNREVRVPAVPAEVVDTTGAGDAFAAGLLGVWPAGEPAAALEAGAALAATIVAREGAR